MYLPDSSLVTLGRISSRGLGGLGVSSSNTSSESLFVHLMDTGAGSDSVEQLRVAVSPSANLNSASTMATGGSVCVKLHKL